jgi:hypothetical protein
LLEVLRQTGHSDSAGTLASCRGPGRRYTHVAKNGVRAVTSPLDLLDGLQQDEVQAAAEATRPLQGQRMLAS